MTAAAVPGCKLAEHLQSRGRWRWKRRLVSQPDMQSKPQASSLIGTNKDSLPLSFLRCSVPDPNLSLPSGVQALAAQLH